MSDEQLMAECLILFLGGHETTSTALTWTWYLLCQHPEIYQKVEQEVDSVLQGRTPTYADVARLPYCLQVFKEAIRLYPPAHAFPRQALHDVEIDGYLVPKGAMVLISPYTLHHREDLFPQPETFDPERFTPEREKQLPRYAYLPFGAGPRNCIGMYFALMEGQLLLATLTQRRHFTLQIAFGWSDEHLHRFLIRGKPYGIGRSGGISFDDNPYEVRLCDFHFRSRETWVYEYDLTDWWQHEIRLEQVLPLDPAKRYPLCIAGKQRGPIVDCGGPWAFMELQDEYPLWKVLPQFAQLLLDHQDDLDDSLDELRRLAYWVGLKCASVSPGAK